MSIPNGTLQKLVQEIESQSNAAQQQIIIVKNQIGAKQRDLRLLELTNSEISTFSKGTNVYQGVGKMFVHTPIPELEMKMGKDTADLKKEVENLGKKLQYLETTHKNSKEHIAQIFSGGRA